MVSISKILTKVHSKVHFLPNTKKYSIGLYLGGAKLSEWDSLTNKQKSLALKKQWYIRWSFRNPTTGKLERQTNIKGGCNRFRTKKQRIEILDIYKKNLVELIESGFSPYDEKEIKDGSIDSVFDYALSVKKKELRETTYKDYVARINNFKDYLNHEGIFLIQDIKKSTVSKFLNKYNGKHSNNFKVTLGSIFSILSDQSIIDYNFIKEIKNKSVRKKAVQVYSIQQVEEITNLLKDDILLMFIQLISYMFLRPIEVVRIEIKDIDLAKGVLRVNTKGKDYKTKIIPDMMLEGLKGFINNRKGLLFELDAKSDIDKRNYITKRFKKFREANNIPNSFKMYHMRHTHITKLYLSFRETLSKKETIEKLSLITGHESKSIFAYIQVNDIELPDDYSDMLK